MTIALSWAVKQIKWSVWPIGEGHVAFLGQHCNDVTYISYSYPQVQVMQERRHTAAAGGTGLSAQLLGMQWSGQENLEDKDFLGSLVTLCPQIKSRERERKVCSCTEPISERGMVQWCIDYCSSTRQALSSVPSTTCTKTETYKSITSCGLKRKHGQVAMGLDPIFLLR